jgi:hypothetical protein
MKDGSNASQMKELRQRQSLPVNLAVLGLCTPHEEPPGIHRRASGTGQVLEGTQWILEAPWKSLDFLSQDSVGGDFGFLLVEPEGVGADGGHPDGRRPVRTDGCGVLYDAPLGGEKNGSELMLAIGIEHQPTVCIALHNSMVDSKRKPTYGFLRSNFSHDRLTGISTGRSGRGSEQDGEQPDEHAVESLAQVA